MAMSPHHLFPVLIGDIGGTHARFQLIADQNSQPQDFDVVKTADFDTIEDAVLKAVFEKNAGIPKSAIMAAAGPITKNGLNLTNCHWNIEPEKFLKAGSFDELVLMNDFEAQALSLPFLDDKDLSPVGLRKPQPENTKVVLGPGTGLGVGLLVRADGKWIPVAGEGGHVDMGPRSAEEQDIWFFLDKVDGRVSAEQILCGDGLVNLYNACCKAENASPIHQQPAEISSAAIAATDTHSMKALTLFCACLGRVAGDLAITANARGGVYIAGGIGKKIVSFLQSSPFRDAFDDKAPHRDIMKLIGTAVVTHELPALLGLAGFAKHPDQFLLDISHRQWWR